MANECQTVGLHFFKFLIASSLCKRLNVCRLRLKCDGTRAETTFRLSAKRTSPFKSAGASFQSTTGNRGVRISGSNAGYTMFRGSVKSTGYLLHSLISLSLPLPCVTVCHHFSTGLYLQGKCVETLVPAFRLATFRAQQKYVWTRIVKRNPKYESINLYRTFIDI
jgi:hypothetical protein